MIEGILKLSETEESFQGPVNLGNPEEKSIVELAEMIKKQVASSSEIVFSNLPQDDPRRRLPDISLAKKKLGWGPQFGLEDGLRKTIEYFKKQVGVL